jgi:hypothetical protein
MPRLFVVFDTNAYRSTSDHDLGAIRDLERSKSVVGMASYWVVFELLAHVADPGDPSYGFALAGVRRLARHAAQYDGQRHILRLLADSEDHVFRALFGYQIPNRANAAETFGRLVGAVADGKSPTDWSAFQPQLDALKSYVAATEAQFAADVFDNVVKAHWPKAQSWSDVASDPKMKNDLIAYLSTPQANAAAAGALVIKAASEISHQLSPEEASRFVTKVLELFPAPIAFYNAFLKKVATGYDLSVSKNVNSLWDMQVVFSTSMEATIGGAPIWIVTSDKAVLSAAVDAHMGSRVMTLSNYRSALSLDIDDFLMRLA